MKRRILLLLLLSLVYGCKNPKDNSTQEDEPIKQTQEQSVNVIKEISLFDVNQWDSRGIKLDKTDLVFRNEEVYELSVLEDSKKSSFIAINNIKLNYTGGNIELM